MGRVASRVGGGGGRCGGGGWRFLALHAASLARDSLGHQFLVDDIALANNVSKGRLVEFLFVLLVVVAIFGDDGAPERVCRVLMGDAREESALNGDSAILETE